MNQLTTTQLTSTIDAYLEGYGEPDPARRTALIERTFADGAVLIDPPLEGRGHDGIASMAATLQSLYPGHRFRRTTAIDEHHGFARYGWQLLDPDGAVVLTGVDMAEVTAEGLLRQVVGFFGDLSPA